MMLLLSDRTVRKASSRECKGTRRTHKLEYSKIHKIDYFASSAREKVTVLHQGSMQLSGLSRY